MARDTATSNEELGLKAFTSQLRAQLKAFNRSRNWHRFLSLLSTFSVAGIAAVTTALVAIAQLLPGTLALSVAAIVAGALTTAAASVKRDAGSDYLWLRKTYAWRQLERLKMLVEFETEKADDVLSQEMIDSLYNKFQNVLGTEHDDWDEFRRIELEQKLNLRLPKPKDSIHE